LFDKHLVYALDGNILHRLLLPPFVDLKVPFKISHLAKKKAFAEINPKHT
jgi:hypothetical protein